MKKKPEKIVVDTNILVSAYIFPGKTVARLFDSLLNGEMKLGISEELLSEFVRVSIFKAMYDPQKTMSIVSDLRVLAEVVTTEEKVNIIKDEPDNRVLECAAAFEADCIISGDRHLLDLKKYKGIEILSPGDYVKKYG